MPAFPFLRAVFPVVLLSALLSLVMGEKVLPAAEADPAAIYAKKCASCHGDKGQGTQDHPDPLVGDRSIRELAELIDRTMPDGKADQCQGEEARLVAAYIHDAFYSIIAQERNRPATVEFSRLTVRQYENAVADVIGSFRGQPKIHREHGLKAGYYHSRNFRRERRLIERRDAVVDFQFGESLPEGYPAFEEPTEGDEKQKNEKRLEHQEFSIKWEGSVIAPETGDYDFIVETENGFRLWLNDDDPPLIDAWVKSGNDTVFRGTRRLLGGRAYPIRLEFFRYREKTASIKLKWKVPHRTEELIPERCLSPDWSPETFVLTTAFPPDDRSIGYERGSSISPEWDEATTYAALETAAYVAGNLNELARTKSDAPDRTAKLKEFSRKFVEQAFRRDLKPDEVEEYVHRHFAAGIPDQSAMKRIVLLALKSPRFLYREIGVGDFDSFSTANWLSFTLWDSIPDQTLLDAARANQLRDREQLERQVDRMLQDPRSLSKTMAFLKQWLNVGHFPELLKDPQLFPGFTPELVSDLQTSLDLFLEGIATSENADFRQLLLSDRLPLNGRLATFYGAELPENAPFQPVALQAGTRAGVLTHPLLLSGYAYDKTSSPIHRGVFLSRSILGRRLKTPPIAVAPLAPDLNPDLNTRERVVLQTSPDVCQTCHTLINSLGFTLENFDAAGRFRETEKDRPIDATGRYLDRGGNETLFQGSRQLAEFLANCPETHESFAEQMFQYMVKQPVRAFGSSRLDELRDTFRQQDFNFRKLLKEIVVSSAISVRELERRDTVRLQ